MIPLQYTISGILVVLLVQLLFLLKPKRSENTYEMDLMIGSLLKVVLNFDQKLQPMHKRVNV